MSADKAMTAPEIPAGTMCSRQAGGYDRWDMGGHPCTHKAKIRDKDGKPICGVHARADKNVADRKDKYAESREIEAARRREAVRLVEELTTKTGVKFEYGYEPSRRMDDPATYTIVLEVAAAQKLLESLTLS